ncbi:sigma-70 family RNA polymerase sigma factor [Muricauda sp. JGD-17]|uniref:Sigma-70 family RNA polymerase sigma factor n=1 Tax=Flagellimonas ochracea TaxID=2696472 RepID=A0A964TDW0_9FLAO|nr:sigma-70 family RNA polymerase sigma factor [Allomuricauda ochracea]NAY93118.1 sigma-70 family RNA polymerase sigma factor [Allomuricauda ochracea]
MLFDKLYDEYYSVIFNYCLRRTGDFHQAYDIASQTFLKAYLKFDNYEEKGIPVVHWFYRIASNEINLFFRSKKYSPTLIKNVYGNYLEELHSYEIEKEIESANIEFEKNMEFIKLHQAVKQLPTNYSDVISLKYFEGMTILEISQILKKKEGTVKSLLSRGISKLRKIMTN